MYKCDRCGHTENTEEKMKDHIKLHSSAKIKISYELINENTGKKSHIQARNGGQVFYFFKEGIIKGKVYSRLLYWGLSTILFLLFWFVTGIGGALGGAMFGGFIVVIIELSLIHPKIKKWDALSLKELKNEKGMEQISWSDISKAVYKMPNSLEIFIGEKRYKLSTNTNSAIMKELLEQKLGKKLSSLKKAD